jgi:penicillin amidase
LKNFALVVFYLLFFVIVVLPIVLLGIVNWVKNSSVPNRSQTLALNGLESAVNVKWDENGLVHIYAESKRDLYFAQGAVMAQERLWQMDFQRHLIKGRLGELVGKRAKKLDVYFRTLGFESFVKSSWDSYPEEGKIVVQSFVDGINAYIEASNPRPLEMILLGVKPTRWEATDGIIWSKMLSLRLSGNMNEELKRLRLEKYIGLDRDEIENLMPPYDELRFPVALNASDMPKNDFEHSQFEATAKDIDFVFEKSSEAQASDETFLSKIFKLSGLHSFDLPNIELTHRKASNNFVVSGKLTSTGKPILANDPHLTFTAPMIWIMMHLSAPSEGINVVGATLVGIPGTVIGRNDHISWGVTNVGADVQDLYVIEIDPNNSSQYLFNNSYKAFDIREEEINFGADASMKLLVRNTVFGPIISDTSMISETGLEKNQALALQWTAFDGKDFTAYGFFKINQAKDWDDFYNASSYIVSPIQNFVFADSDGNIAYLMPGKIPIRSHDTDGKHPMPGNGTFYWKGYIPFERLPRVLNPASGFIVTANNKIVPDSYPYLITNDWDAGDEGYRAERITEMIKSAGKNFSVEFASRIQADYLSLHARDLISSLVKLDFADNDNANSWKSRLLNWDFNAKIGSFEESVFIGWYSKLTGFFYTKTKRKVWNYSTLYLNLFNSSDPDFLRFAKNAFSEAVERYSSRAWGSDLHQAYFPNQVLSQSPLGCCSDRYVDHGGDEFTVNAGGMDLSDTDTFVNEAGPSVRFISDLGNVENSLMMMPLGQSGNEFSPDYDNLLDKWSKTEYIPMSSAPSSQISPKSSQTLTGK